VDTVNFLQVWLHVEQLNDVLMPLPIRRSFGLTGVLSFLPGIDPCITGEPQVAIVDDLFTLIKPRETGRTPWSSAAPKEEPMADLSERRWLYRIGGAAAVVGSLLGMVGNLVHPPTAGPGDPASTAQVVAESGSWIPIHLAIIVGLVLMLGGLVAIRQSIRGGLAGALAQLGLALAVVCGRDP